jgi:hypothetical protein
VVERYSGFGNMFPFPNSGNKWELAPYHQILRLQTPEDENVTTVFRTKCQVRNLFLTCSIFSPDSSFKKFLPSVIPSPTNKIKCRNVSNLHIPNCWWENVRERDRLGDPGVDGRIMLRWILRKWDVGYGLDRAGSG